MRREIPIDEELRDRLADGRLLPVVDLYVKGEQGKYAQSRRNALARLLSSTGVPAVIAYRDPGSLYSELVNSNSRWRMADGYDTRASSDTRLVLSPGEIGGSDSWEDAWFRVEHRQPVLWDRMISYAARFPLLLIGTDPESDALQDLVARLRPHRYFAPSGWIVAESVTENAARRWQDLGLTVVSLTDEAFVRAYTKELNLRSYSKTAWISDESDQFASRPFKLLDYYDVNDAPIFYARQRETSTLVNLVTSNRLVIVTGPSGAGKTSLLKAGLIAHINRFHPYKGLYVRFMEDPVGELLAALERELSITTERPRGHDVRDWHEMWQAIDQDDSLPVIIFDQGEELFTRFENTMRDDLFSSILEAVVHPRSRSRFVIGIREDYLAHLADFASQLPSILQTSFYVGALTKEQAHEAIRKPFENFGIGLERGLEIQIADEIGVERVASPQIQIVCDRLFSTRKSDFIGLDDYRLLGGTEGILSDFLNDQLQLLGENREGVVEILKSLVTSEGTKDVLSLDELCERSGIPKALSEILVDYLSTKSRLLRPVSGRSGIRYELSHEYLTHEIWQWMTPAELARREAQELIAADLRAWTTFDSLRLGVDRLERYYKHWKDLKVDEHVGTLLLLSSVRHSRPHDVWVQAISKLPGTVQTRVAWSLLRFIATCTDEQRFEAAEAVAALDSGVIVRALKSPERNIRHAALFMAGGLCLSTAQPVLIEALKNVDDDHSGELACLALGEIGGAGAVDMLIQHTSSPSIQIAGAAVRGLGSCIEEAAFPYLMAALCEDRPTMVRAAQLAVAAAVSENFSIYLAQNIEAETDAIGRAISIDTETRLNRLLGGLDCTQKGNARLVTPLARLIRAYSIDTDQFSASWLIEEIKRIRTGKRVREKQSWQRIKEKLLTADDVVAALQKYRTDSVAKVLADAGSRSLPILRGLSSHNSVEVRITILTALWYYRDIQIDSTWRTYIHPSLLERGLKDKDAGVRYFACLAVEHLGLVECIPFVRILARDDSRGAWTRSVGPRVSDAANRALDTLRPESSVWRKDWQLKAESL
jgi:hypothetical protein